MRDKLNCPNCGAPIESTQCPYCGTVFYDFSVIDVEKPSYIRLKYKDNVMIFRAKMIRSDLTFGMDQLFLESGLDYRIMPIIQNYSGRLQMEFDIVQDKNCLVEVHTIN